MRIFLFFFLLLQISISNAFAHNADSVKPLIITSINPLYQILLAITEDKNNSILVINPGVSEHNYQLKKKDIKYFSKADLVFYIDDALETNFPKLIKNNAAENKSYQLSKINGLKLLQKRDGSKKLDVHLWLNPQNAVKIAEFMTQKICEIDQKNSVKYRKNLEKFKQEIVSDEKLIRFQAAKINEKKYIIYHDGYQYFEDYFALKPLKIMSYDHNRELSIKDARELDLMTKSNDVKCMFSEVSDEKNSALKLAQNYKIKFMTLDLIGRKENFSYSVLLLKIADDMRECLADF